MLCTGLSEGGVVPLMLGGTPKPRAEWQERFGRC